MRVLSICLALGLVFAVGCKNNSSSKKSDSESGVDAKPDTTDDGNASNNSNNSEDTYTPMKGDVFKYQSNSKAWDGSATEPESWTEGEMTVEVLGLYVDEAPCSYRTKNTIAGVSSETDMGCESGEACGTTGTESDCTEEDEDSVDVGDFNDSKGKKTICTVVTDLPTGKMLTRSETSTWTNDDAKTENNVVKTVYYTCSAMLAADASTEINPCEDAGDASVNFFRTDNELVEQTQGEGGDAISKWPGGEFTTSGVDNKSGTVTATCSSLEIPNLPRTLSISLGKTFCSDDKYEVQNASFNQLDLKSGTQKTGLGGASLFAGGKSFMGPDQGCEVSYEVVDNYIQGSANCSVDLTVFGSEDKATIENAEFTCALPAGMSADDFGSGSSDDVTDTGNNDANSSGTDNSNSTTGNDTSVDNSNSNTTDSGSNSSTAGLCKFTTIGVCQERASMSNVTNKDDVAGMENLNAGNSVGQCHIRASQIFNWCGPSAELKVISTFVVDGTRYNYWVGGSESCKVRIQGNCNASPNLSNKTFTDNWGIGKQAGFIKDACLKRATDFMNWCGGENKPTVTATFGPNNLSKTVRP